MKITLTALEIKAGNGILEQVIAGANSIAVTLGDAVTNISTHGTISDEDIAEFNSTMNGIVVITKNGDEFEFNISEQFVIDSCDLTRDAVIELYDVLKYAVKTFKAFMALSVKPFVDKYQKIVENNSTTAH